MALPNKDINNNSRALWVDKPSLENTILMTPSCTNMISSMLAMIKAIKCNGEKGNRIEADLGDLIRYGLAGLGSGLKF